SPLVFHWNGTKWNRVTITLSHNGATLYAVTARAANDVWAVGYYYDMSNDQHALAEHWNGHTFVQVPTADVPNGENQFFSVSPIPGGGLWATGETRIQGKDAGLIERYNGSTWSIVPAAVLAGESELNGVVATGPNDAWVVGYHGSLIQKTLVEH